MDDSHIIQAVLERERPLLVGPTTRELAAVLEMSVGGIHGRLHALEAKGVLVATAHGWVTRLGSAEAQQNEDAHVPQ